MSFRERRLATRRHRAASNCGFRWPPESGGGPRAATSALTGVRLGLAACPDHVSPPSAAHAVGLNANGIRRRFPDPSSGGIARVPPLEGGGRPAAPQGWESIVDHYPRSQKAGDPVGARRGHPICSTSAASTTTAMATRARQAVRGWGPYPTGTRRSQAGQQLPRHVRTA